VIAKSVGAGVIRESVRGCVRLRDSEWRKVLVQERVGARD
jgi:hypothetical protein